MLIDAHSHMDMYGDSLDAALEEITRHDIFTVSTSMDLSSYGRAVEIGEASGLVLPTFGVHPWSAPHYAHRLGDLDEAIERSPMLGEIGLDYHFVEDPSQYPAQRRVFEFFLSAAREQKKIVNLHTKGAERDILSLLEEYEIERAIIHWYSGPLDVFHEMVAYGAYFTIGVEVNHSEHIRTIARELQADRVLTETDNPGGLEWLTGELGMPLHIGEVIRALAELRRSTPEAIIQTVSSNFERLIRDDPWLVDIHRMLFEEGQNQTQ